MFDFKTVATISTAYGAILLLLGLFEATRSGDIVSPPHAGGGGPTGFLSGKEGIRRSRYTGGGAQQHNTNDGADDEAIALSDELDSVAEMAQHAWNGYLKAAKKNAREQGVAYLDTDEVSPVSGKPTSQWGGIAVTAFDSMTTFLALGMDDEFAEAAAIALEVCDAKFSHPKGGKVRGGKLRLSVFETTIRHLGSLLSVYAQTQDERYLSCATRIGTALLEAFDERSGIPFHSIIFGSQPVSRSNDAWTGDRMILAEVGSLQLEFRYLSYFTGNPKFATAVNQFTEKLMLFRSQGWPKNQSHFESGGSNGIKNIPHSGLWPTFINPRDSTVRGSVSFGSLGDSFYEYLLKQWVAFGKQDEHLAELYEDAVEGMLEHLLRYTSRTHYAFLGQISQGYDPRQNHLACFVPGMLTLGVMHGVHSRPHRRNKDRKWGNDDVITAAADLTATCYRLYIESPTGLAPEEVIFQDDGSYKVSDSGYYLRPETVESIYYLYRFTDDPKYKNWLETIRHRIDLACRTRDGFASLSNTHGSSSEKKDRMETFFIAETLKYLWLGLHGKKDSMPLDRYILNTEAHPLPIIFDKEVW